MVSKFERFWIIFILRVAFGFLFCFAAINIFTYGGEKFVTELSKGFESTWIGQVTIGEYTGMQVVKLFLYGAPYLMSALSVAILTGILLKPALRVGALLLIGFGLGKYAQNDIPTTAADFLFAFLICVGLYFMSLEKHQIVSNKKTEQ